MVVVEDKELAEPGVRAVLISCGITGTAANETRSRDGPGAIQALEDEPVQTGYWRHISLNT